MCGLCGFLYKDADRVGPVGRTLHAMLGPMARRGTDSTGIALYGPPQPDSYVVRARIDANHGTPERVVAALEAAGTVTERSQQGPNMRARIAYSGDLGDAHRQHRGRARRRGVLDRPGDGDRQGGRRRRRRRGGRSRTPAFEGSHAIGHTRMATESLVDVAHSHPFWARPFPDISVVHNGHITNYHKLRRRLENQGHRFATGNDSEVIAVYIADKLERGESLEDALRGVGLRPGRHLRLPDLDAGRDRRRPRPVRAQAAALRRVRRCRADRLRGGRDPRRRRRHRARAARARRRGGALVATLTSDIDCSRHTTREINQAIKRAAADGVPEIHLANPAARHSLAVAVMQPIEIVFDGPVGWFCGGMCDGARITVHGNCGWSLGENLMSGAIERARQRRLLGGGDDARRARLHRRRHRRPGRHLDEGRHARRRRVGRLHVRLHDAARRDDRVRRRGRRHRRLDVRGHRLRRRRDRLARRRLHRGRAGRRRPRPARAPSCSRTASTPARRGWKKLVAGRKLWNFSRHEYDAWRGAL